MGGLMGGVMGGGHISRNKIQYFTSPFLIIRCLECEPDRYSVQIVCVGAKGNLDGIKRKRSDESVKDCQGEITR